MHRWLQFRLRTIFFVTTLCAATIALLSRAQELTEAARKLDIERSIAASFAETVKFDRFRHPLADPAPLPPATQRLSDQWMALARHHERMRDKRLAARWQPWVLLAPDPRRPPEPIWPKIIR
jgi:hypothetical protein